MENYIRSYRYSYRLGAIPQTELWYYKSFLVLVVRNKVRYNTRFVKT